MKERELKTVPRWASVTAVTIAIIFILGFISAPPDGHTGAPGESLCTSCHSPGSSIQGNVMISGLPSEIEAGASYDIVVTSTYTAGSAARAGFQLVSLYSNNTNAGTFHNLGSNVVTSTSQGRTYSKHSPAKFFGAETEVMYTFSWTAPQNPTTNSISFYAASVIANGDGTNSGDRVVSTTAQAMIEDTSVEDLIVEMEGTDVSCFGGNDGTASAIASGGDGNFSYNWSTGSTNQSISNLFAGTYIVTVSDGSGQQVIESITISEPPQLHLDVLNVDQITCSQPNATINVFASGGSPGYFYLWSNGSTGPDIQVSATGTYSVTVTDIVGCTNSLSVDVTEDTEVPIIDAGSNQTLPCPSTQINLMGTGPTGQEFAILWFTPNGNIVSGQNTYEPVVDAPGQYFLSVTNVVNGCISEESTEVFLFNNPMQLSISSLNISCNGSSDGSTEVTITGGIPPYQSISWSNGQSGEMITNLGPGNYTVTVTDSEGCTATASATITQPPPLTLNIITTQMSGPDANDGTATAVPGGGTPPYTYQWSTSTSTDSILTNLSSGTYSLTLSDTNNCTLTQNFVIENFGCDLTTQINILDSISCFGANDGSLEAASAGGTPPYSYQWSNGDSTAVITNLSPGNYFVTVVDSVGCILIRQQNLSQPDELDVAAVISHESGFNREDGAIEITINGGTPPYNVLWNTGEDSTFIDELAPDQYFLTVTDSNGCMYEDSFNILAYICDLTLDSMTVEDVLCFGDENGQISVFASSSRLPLNYLWSNDSTDSQLTHLAPGHYSLTITDEADCLIETDTLIISPSELQVEITEWTMEITDPSGGILQVSISGGSPPYSITWTKDGSELEDTDSTLTQLNAGFYAVEVIDNNGCEFFIDSLVIELITSISEINSSTDLQLFPVPVFDLLHIRMLPNKLLKIPLQFRIIDIYGNTVGHIPSTDYELFQTIDVSKLSAGVYFINVRHKDQHWTGRFIKI